MKRNKYTQDVHCQYCGTLMTLDDIDYNFEGNQNNYWLCQNCNGTCFQKVRYGKVVKSEFSNGEENEKN